MILIISALSEWCLKSLHLRIDILHKNFNNNHVMDTVIAMEFEKPNTQKLHVAYEYKKIF